MFALYLPGRCSARRERRHVHSAVDTPKDQAEDDEEMHVLPSIPVPISAVIQQQERLTVESSLIPAESGLWSLYSIALEPFPQHWQELRTLDFDHPQTLNIAFTGTCRA